MVNGIAFYKRNTLTTWDEKLFFYFLWLRQGSKPKYVHTAVVYDNILYSLSLYGVEMIPCEALVKEYIDFVPCEVLIDPEPLSEVMKSVGYRLQISDLIRGLFHKEPKQWLCTHFVLNLVFAESDSKTLTPDEVRSILD